MDKFITDFTGLKYNRFGWPILPKGTKVLMKENMKSIFSHRIVTPGMMGLAGKLKTITGYGEAASNESFYYRLDGSEYFFDPGMFDVIELPETIIDTDKKTIHIAKYQKGYITIVDGYFDDQNIFLDINEITKKYKNYNIVKLF